MPHSDLIHQPASSTTFIYALRDPTTQQIRYIGKSDTPKKRLRAHLGGCRRGERGHRPNWLRSLASNGLKPILEIVDEVLIDEWQAAEAAYIIFYKEEGYPLVNGTPGGDGLGTGEDNPLFKKPRSPEVRAKIRASLIGHGFAPETLAKMSAARKGVSNPKNSHPPSPKARVNMSIAQRRRFSKNQLPLF